MTDVDKYLAGLSDEAEIRGVFQTIAPPYTAEVDVCHEPNYYSIVVQGTILDADGIAIGRFSREIKRPDRRPVYVIHAQSQVDLEHQGHGILSSQMSALIPYYVNTLHAQCVELSAKLDGPVVWPKFGFEFQADNDDILDVLEELYSIEHADPRAIPRLARNYAVLSLPSRPRIGSEAICAVQQRIIDENSNDLATMPMLLPLDDSSTLDWLRAKGFL